MLDSIQGFYLGLIDLEFLVIEGIFTIHLILSSMLASVEIKLLKAYPLSN